MTCCSVLPCWTNTQPRSTGATMSIQFRIMGLLKIQSSFTRLCVTFPPADAFGRTKTSTASKSIFERILHALSIVVHFTHPHIAIVGTLVCYANPITDLLAELSIPATLLQHCIMHATPFPCDARALHHRIVKPATQSITSSRTI